ncbi:hypothetical protein TYRP_006728 [Tyrophagus putrescentiae]|nr:hypothetical protein TYRP_006728 [Tyrophagus putrescentiae]
MNRNRVETTTTSDTGITLTTQMSVSRLTLTTLGHCERLPTRAPLAPLARPESVDVHNAQVSSDLAALGFKQRLTLASLGSPKTPADSDLARSAREALVGEPVLGPCSLRSQGPQRRTLHIDLVTSDLAALGCAPPAAQSESDGSGSGSNSSENGSESAQFWPTLQLLR